MAIRDKLRRNVAPFLEQDEQVQAVFQAQSGPNPYLLFLTYLLAFLNKYVVVAVTNRRILVLRAGAFRPAVPKSVQQTLPRETKLGPVKGPLWAKIQLGDTRYWVHRRYYDDVRAADAAAPAQ